MSRELNLSMQEHKVIDSLLNSIPLTSVIIDVDSFKILYQNNRAKDMLGDRVGMLCHEVICSADVPCLDCPRGLVDGSEITREKYAEAFDTSFKWNYRLIDWVDGEKVYLACIVNNAYDDNVFRNYALKAAADVEDRMRELDQLTNLPNYSKFCSVAEQAIKSNPDKDYAIVVFDIERFNSINDLYGMIMGDDVLKHIATTLQGFFNNNNYARLHSDRFAYYVSYNTKGDIIRGIERLRKKIDNNEFEFDVQLAFGIYLASERDLAVNLMCDRAFMASRTIKGNIMKFCAFYDEHYREDLIKTNAIEKDMRKALENREFKMYLQPKYRLDDDNLCGAEVLCRWIHPTKGIIPPNDFIPLFERNGFILRLDEYMWEEACRTLRKWIDEGKNPIPLSVNISRYHINHNNLNIVLNKLLKKYRITPDLLTLEITESLFLDKPEELNRVLVGLQEMGFKLEVDDFGAGFSSLNLIRNITVDTIKIDKEFLDKEIATEKGKIVVNHTIDMAKDLKLQVIAEGVETKEHVDFLKNSNCDIAQGYYYAKPMPLDEFNAKFFNN